MSRSPLTLAKQQRAFPVGLLLVGAMLLAVAVRLYGISTESLWLDETTSLMLARKDLPALIQWTAADIHPPLYYILLHYWIALGQSEAIIRGLSALAGVLSVPVLYALGQTLFDRRTGLYAAFGMALAPAAVWYAQETRMYTWIALLSSASVLLALWAWQKRGWAVWVGYVLVTAAALYTHYYAAFAILLENLVFLYLLLRRRVGWGLFWQWAGAQAAIFLLFLPWFPIFLLPLRAGGGGWVTVSGGKPSLAVIAQTIVLYMVGTARALFPSLLRRLGYLLFAGILLAGIWPRGLGKGKVSAANSLQGALYGENEALLFNTAWLALPLGIVWGGSQLLKPMYSARYMLPFLTPFILLVARGVRNLPWKLLQGAAPLALVAVMGVGIAKQVELPEKPDWRTWSARVVSLAQPGDLVLFVPGWHAGPFDYYAHGALPLYSEVPVPVPNYGAQALAKVDDGITGYKRVWLIWETDHYTDPQGAVYDHLRARCTPVSELQMPRLGRIVLFEACSGAGGS